MTLWATSCWKRGCAVNTETGKKSNRKGKNGEREFVRTVFRLTNGKVEFKRNLQQSRDGGEDLIGHHNLSIEVKRWKKVSDAIVRDWWVQCQRNARERGRVPVLAYRADLQSWKVVMHPREYFHENEIQGCMTIDVELFARLLLDPKLQLPLSYH